MRKIFYFCVLGIISLVFVQFSFIGIGDSIEKVESTSFLTNDSVSSDQFLSKKACVFIWYDETCPFSKIYKKRLFQLFDENKNNNIVFVLFFNQENDNKLISKELSHIENVFCWNDIHNTIAKKLEVKVMPEVLVLTPVSHKFKLCYKGAIDDNINNGKNVTHHYLRDALNSISVNKPIKVTQKKATGCDIF